MILTLLATKAGTYIIGGAVVLAAFVATYVKGRLSGAALERNAQKAKEADSYAKHLQDIVLMLLSLVLLAAC